MGVSFEHGHNCMQIANFWHFLRRNSFFNYVPWLSSLPYLLIFEILTFKDPFEEQDVSYQREFEKSVNQWLKINERSKFVRFTKQLSIMI